MLNLLPPNQTVTRHCWDVNCLPQSSNVVTIAVITDVLWTSRGGEHHFPALMSIITSQAIWFQAMKLIKEEPHRFAGGRPITAQKFPLTFITVSHLDQIGTNFRGVNLYRYTDSYVCVYMVHLCAVP